MVRVIGTESAAQVAAESGLTICTVVFDATVDADRGNFDTLTNWDAASSKHEETHQKWIVETRKTTSYNPPTASPGTAVSQWSQGDQAAVARCYWSDGSTTRETQIRGRMVLEYKSEGDVLHCWGGGDRRESDFEYDAWLWYGGALGGKGRDRLCIELPCRELLGGALWEQSGYCVGDPSVGVKKRFDPAWHDQAPPPDPFPVSVRQENRSTRFLGGVSLWEKARQEVTASIFCREKPQTP